MFRKVGLLFCANRGFPPLLGALKMGYKSGITGGQPSGGEEKEDCYIFSKNYKINTIISFCCQHVITMTFSDDYEEDDDDDNNKVTSLAPMCS